MRRAAAFLLIALWALLIYFTPPHTIGFLIMRTLGSAWMGFVLALATREAPPPVCTLPCCSGVALPPPSPPTAKLPSPPHHIANHLKGIVAAHPYKTP